jgi:hypothetical protein
LRGNAKIAQLAAQSGGGAAIAAHARSDFSALKAKKTIAPAIACPFITRFDRANCMAYFTQSDQICPPPKYNANQLEPQSGRAIAPKLPAKCRYPDRGSPALAIRPGTPPHAAALHCEQCDRWQQWLGKAIATKLGFGAEVQR